MFELNKGIPVSVGFGLFSRRSESLDIISTLGIFLYLFMPPTLKLIGPLKKTQTPILKCRECHIEIVDDDDDDPADDDPTDDNHVCDPQDELNNHYLKIHKKIS